MPLLKVAQTATLSAFTDQGKNSRDNNFNLLRFGAATAVVLSHSILLTGNFNNHHAWRIGYLAVNCFFIISGFLVCGSLMRRRRLGEYAAARLLRIYPALVVVVLLTAFVPGLILSALGPATYLSDPGTLNYVVVNSLLVVGKIELNLPGLFGTNPLPVQVNAPLWTLQYELVMYAALAAVWWLCRLLAGTLSGRTRAFTLIVAGITVVCTVGYIENVASSTPVVSDFHHLLRFGAMFGAGACYYLLRNHVSLSGLAAIAILALVVICQSVRPLLVTLTYLALPYLLLCLAYLPGGWLREFNRLGDYSYGIYIIAFPAQQSLMHLFPSLQPAGLFVSSMAVTLPLAMLSWHALEYPALRLKPGVSYRP